MILGHVRISSPPIFIAEDDGKKENSHTRIFQLFFHAIYILKIGKIIALAIIVKIDSVLETLQRRLN